MASRDAIEAALRRIAPKVPAHECGAIVDHAMDSVGLSTASAETAAWLSLVSYVRHVLTDYDEMLEHGYDVESARHFVAPDMDAVLAEWGVRRKISATD